MANIIFKNYIKRLEQLCKEGEVIAEKVRDKEEIENGCDFYGVPEDLQDEDYYAVYKLDPLERKFRKWKLNCKTIIQRIVPENNHYFELIKDFDNLSFLYREIENISIALEAFKDDYENGFIDDLLFQLESEVASDYLEQAKQLFEDGYHIGAITLSAAVLEKFLKVIYERHKKIPFKEKIPCFEKVINAFSGLGIAKKGDKEKLMKWKEMRNSAAHGKFEELESDPDKLKKDIQEMVEGISNFIERYGQ